MSALFPQPSSYFFNQSQLPVARSFYIYFIYTIESSLEAPTAKQTINFNGLSNWN